jgi:light-independent protochlorophyllide reductase subunit B
MCRTFRPATRPQMGFEGANVLFDSWVHPLVMGLEEHLLTMFRDDFEFHDAAGPSHLGAGHGGGAIAAANDAANTPETAGAEPEGWTADAEKELLKIPFFVRGKARRNTEAYAVAQGIGAITVATLYEAKAYHAR